MVTVHRPTIHRSDEDTAAPVPHSFQNTNRMAVTTDNASVADERDMDKVGESLEVEETAPEWSVEEEKKLVRR